MFRKLGEREREGERPFHKCISLTVDQRYIPSEKKYLNIRKTAVQT